MFDQPDPKQVTAQFGRVEAQLRERFPAVADYLADAREDLLAFSVFPVEHWTKIRSNNPQERLNKEIRRRTDVVGIFPDRASAIRLIGAVLAEQHHEWSVGRRYLSAESPAKARTKSVTGPSQAPDGPTKEVPALPAASEIHLAGDHTRTRSSTTSEDATERRLA